MGQQLGPEFVMDRGEPWLTLIGLCAIMDPPRPECVAAITEAHGAGVRVAMITVSTLIVFKQSFDQQSASLSF
jgi:hypothetical protein